MTVFIQARARYSSTKGFVRRFWKSAEAAGVTGAEGILGDTAGQIVGPDHKVLFKLAMGSHRRIL